MKILIAPDSFKGSVSSMDASKAIERAIHEIDPSIETLLFPMADGGEGTVDAVLWSKHGEKISCRVLDPIGREIEAIYGWIEEEKTAVIEVAAASGLPLLKKEELNPEKASSYGTGQLIKDALAKGAEKIILGLGGSATIDAGTGLFQALGMKLFDEHQNELGVVGGRLEQIAAVDVSGLSPGLSDVQIIVASDVTNPLLGKEGAITVFGPQKGVEEKQIPVFEEGMRKFSEIAAQAGGRNRNDNPGSGAAGGIGFMLNTFLEVEFRNGLGVLIEMVQFEKQLLDADLVLTGEGRIDGQSLFGKVPVGIGRLAKKYKVPVIAFAGSVGLGVENLEEEGIIAVMPIPNGPISLDEAMLEGEVLLYQAAKRLLKLIKLGEAMNE